MRILTALDRLRLLAADDAIRMIGSPWDHDLPSRPPDVLITAAKMLTPGFSHSALEARMREVIIEVAAEMGFSATTRPFEIKVAGRRVAEVDVAISAIRFGAEVDGPPHMFGGQRRRDHSRDRRLDPFDWTIRRYASDEYGDDLDLLRRRVGRDIQQAAAVAEAA